MAREDVRGIILFPDMLDMLDMLNMEERGVILTALLHYKLGLDLPVMNKHTEVVFRCIRGVQERNAQRYRSTSGRGNSPAQSRYTPQKTRSFEEEEIHEICQQVTGAKDDWDDDSMLPF